MKKILEALGIGSLVTGGLAAGFNLGMLIGYIKDTKLGLEFINKLRPITYKTKPSSEYPKEFGVKEPSKKSSGKTWDGLIAQEVKEVIDEMDVEFSGWEEGVNTKQRLAYGKFVMPLIKAVQELSARIKELEGK